ncbi:MAG: hypothetical protein ABSF54_13750 [Bryobacteraceae bacterium]|jgi:hypothetical protein
MKDGVAELEALAVRLRALVGERRYREAQDALAEYCRALRQTLAGLPRGDARLGWLEDEWRRLAAETRRRVLEGRAQAAARLVRLAQTSRRSHLYGADREPRRTWEWLA